MVIGVVVIVLVLVGVLVSSVRLHGYNGLSTQGGGSGLFVTAGSGRVRQQTAGPGASFFDAHDRLTIRCGAPGRFAYLFPLNNVARRRTIHVLGFAHLPRYGPFRIDAIRLAGQTVIDASAPSRPFQPFSLQPGASQELRLEGSLPGCSPLATGETFSIAALSFGVRVGWEHHTETIDLPQEIGVYRPLPHHAEPARPRPGG